jgi:hypothetical protein
MTHNGFDFDFESIPINVMGDTSSAPVEFDWVCLTSSKYAVRMILMSGQDAFDNYLR